MLAAVRMSVSLDWIGNMACDLIVDLVKEQRFEWADSKGRRLCNI